VAIEPKIPSILTPKFIHTIQKNITVDGDDLWYTVGDGELQIVHDDIEIGTDIIVEGDFHVVSTLDGYTSHTLLPDRDADDSHPSSAITWPNQAANELGNYPVMTYPMDPGYLLVLS